MKKAYIVPEALFISLAVEDNTNDLRPGFNDVSTNLNGDDFNDIFDMFN